jgi:hypothetical protein
MADMIDNLRNALSFYSSKPMDTIKKRIPKSANRVRVQTMLNLGMDTAAVYSMDRCNPGYQADNYITLGEAKRYEERRFLGRVELDASAFYGRYKFNISSVVEGKNGVKSGIIEEKYTIDGVQFKPGTWLMFDDKGHVVKYHYAMENHNNTVLIYNGLHIYEVTAKYDTSRLGLESACLAKDATIDGRLYKTDVTLYFENGRVVSCWKPGDGKKKGEECSN